jgi:hypothetical protein
MRIQIMVARAVSARRTRVLLGSEARMIALQASARTSRERAMETSGPSTPEVAAARTTAIEAIGAEGDKRYRASAATAAKTGHDGYRAR